jgi:hypothetical protein
MGIAGRSSGSAGTASGGITRMGCRRTRRSARGLGRCATRPHLGRRAARAAGSCAAPRGGCACSPAARPDVGCPAGGRCATTTTATTAAPRAPRASRRRATAGGCATRADVGIGRACCRPACAGLESTGGALMGCRAGSAFRATRARLGRAGRFGRAGHAARAVME